MNRRFVFWTGIAGVVLFVVSTILGGLQLPGYSHVSQLISESYAMGTPYGEVLRYLGFLPSGLLLFLFCLLASRQFPTSKLTLAGFVALGIFYGLATVVVSIFPCDEGCNKGMIDPSVSQLIHNTTGLLTYLVVPFSLLLIGRGLMKVQKQKPLGYLAMGVGVNCFLFIALLAANPLTATAGLYQRITEGGILLWIVVCASVAEWK